MMKPYWRKTISQYMSGASIEERLLVYLAVATYLSSGLYIALFTAGIDFDLVYQAAVRLVHGQADQIYFEFFAFQPGQNPLFYMYPPAVAMFYSPLGLLPRWLAFGVYQLLSHAFLWGAVLLFCRTWCVDVRDRRLSVCLFLLFYPLYYCLQMGQSETLLLWCLIASLKWFKEERFVISSFVLVIAMELKIFLLLFLLYFILIKRWRYVLWCLAWLGLWSLLSWVLVPPDVLHAYVVKLGSSIGIEAFVDNQSLTGFFMRSLTFNPYTHGFGDWPEAARLLTTAVTLVIMGYYAVIIRRVCRRAPLEETFALTLITVLLAAPYTDTHHLTLLLIPFVLLVASGRFTESASLFYAFFACFIPLWGFKFLSIERGLFFAQHFSHVILSVPCFVLIGFWMYWIHGILGEGGKGFG